MPTNESQIPSVVSVLFHWKTNKIQQDCIVFCLTCYNRCTGHLQSLDTAKFCDPLLPAELIQIQHEAIKTILAEICRGTNTITVYL